METSQSPLRSQNDLVHIYTIAYNEEVLLQKMIDHYKERFPNCPITIFDNQSTDNTKQIALNSRCEVIEYDSNNEVRDDLYLEIKNNCWKGQKERWALIVDVDEFVYIDQKELLLEQEYGTTIVSFIGWNMITLSDDPDIIDLNPQWASRAPQYDKAYLFDTLSIKDINYSAGCHFCSPVGKIKYSEYFYHMSHFKALGLNYIINRHTEFGKRLSKQNLEKGWGFHYKDSEQQIRDNWKFYQTHPDNKKVL